MTDWIGLGFILLLVFGGLYLLTRPSKPVTQEEHERRVQEGPGLLGAGVMGLQKILDPAAEKAAAVQEDFRQGYLDGEQESGEGNETTPAAENGTTPTAENETTPAAEKMNSSTGGEGDA